MSYRGILIPYLIARLSFGNALCARLRTVVKCLVGNTLPTTHACKGAKIIYLHLIESGMENQINKAKYDLVKKI